MKKQLSPFVGAVVLVVGPVAVRSQSAEVSCVQIPISLAEARRLAFQRNWDLLAAQSDVDIATAERLVAREFPNPTISLSLAKWGDHSGSTSSGNDYWNRNYDTVAAVTQLFEIGGKRRARQESARASLRNAEAKLADARRLLDAGVTQSYVAALLAARRQQILADSASSLRKEAAIAESRQHAGDISVTDKHQIEIAAERLDVDAASAQAEARNARIALEVLLGESLPQGKIMLTDALEPLAQLPGGVASMSCPVASRPDVVAAEAARTKADADLRLQKAMRIPDPMISAQYEHEPPDQPNTAGIGVSFPLPLWNLNKGNIAAARSARDQADLQLNKVRAQALADIATAQVTCGAMLERWHRYQNQLMPKSHDICESVSLAYQRGGASLLDLLSAQRNDNDVRLETVQAAADAASAVAALRATLFDMDPVGPSNSIPFSK